MFRDVCFCRQRGHACYNETRRVLFICQEGVFMAIERRKDNKNRVLKEGEYQRSNGTFASYGMQEKRDLHYLLLNGRRIEKR